VRVGGCGTEISSLDGGKSVKKSNSMMTIDLERMVCVERKESVLISLLVSHCGNLSLNH
jgi:hypothetical protein